MRGTIFVALAAAAFALAGCAELREDVREFRDMLRKLRGREPAPPPPTPPVTETPAPAPGATPAAVAGLTLRGSCIGKEETGYAENVRVDVANGQVRLFDARIDIPNRGSCRYQLADFRQTQQAPYVELLARANAACAVRMWQQGDRVTVAATDCAEKCSRGAFEYAWPIEFNAGSGGCY